jgi:outer membrane protein assembly factor BamA
MTHMKSSIRASVVCLVISFAPEWALAQALEPPLEVQEIRCVGNASTSCGFLRQHLYLRVGQSLDEDEIRNAELRLTALRNFESVDIRLEKGARRGAVVIVIDVREANPVAVETIGGVSSRLDSQRAVIGARLTHLDLFGAGRLADLTAVAATPVAGRAHYESYDVVARYADPQLFDSRRWFAVAKAGWHKRDTLDTYGNFTHLDTVQLDVNVGHRFANFSYFTVGMSWRPNGDWTVGRWSDDGRFTVSRPDYEVTANIMLGWSTEDDIDFPTQGSTFQLAAGGDYGSNSPSRQSHLQLRKTWHWHDSYWTFKIGGDPSPEYRNSLDESQLLAVTWSRPLGISTDLRRGRWYVEPGIGVSGHDYRGRDIYEAGLKIGIRAESRRFGMINLYAIGTVDDSR